MCEAVFNDIGFMCPNEIPRACDVGHLLARICGDIMVRLDPKRLVFIIVKSLFSLGFILNLIQQSRRGLTCGGKNGNTRGLLRGVLNTYQKFTFYVLEMDS